MNVLNYYLRYSVSMANYVYKKITYEERLLPIMVEDIIKYRPDIKIVKGDLLGLDGYSIYNKYTKKYIIALDDVNFDLIYPCSWTWSYLFKTSHQIQIFEQLCKRKISKCLCRGALNAKRNYV